MRTRVHAKPVACSAMGAKPSKNERIMSSSRKGHRSSQDDLQSRATQQTDESSLSPNGSTSGTGTGSAQDSHSVKSLQFSRHLSESNSTTTRGSNHYHHSKQWPSMLPAKEEVRDPSRRCWLPQEAELRPAMSSMDGSKTVPVKLPYTNHESTLQQESDEAIYLAKVYDSRTWEMYRRITESRKNTPYQSSSAPSSMMIPKGENTSEWENMQGEVDASPSGHEMIFLFDFD